MEKEVKELVDLFIEYTSKGNENYGAEIAELKQFLDAARIPNELKDGKNKYTEFKTIAVPVRDLLTACVYGTVFVYENNLENVKEVGSDIAPATLGEEVGRFNEGEKEDLYRDMI